MPVIAQQEQRSTLSAIIELANPVFIVIAVCVPIGPYAISAFTGNYHLMKYTHIMTGALWTGIDLFMGFVLGPVLGGMDPRERANVFKRLMPRMTFLMPVVAGV